MNFVSVEINGGLGNQLFQIAITLEYAKKHNKKAIFRNKQQNELNKAHEETAFDNFLIGLNIMDIKSYNIINFDNIIILAKPKLLYYQYL